MRHKNLKSADGYVEKQLKKNPELKFLYDEEQAISDIARMVRTVRESAGLSQRDLAELAGISQSVVARLESGTDSRTPSLSLIFKLLNAAGAKLELHCKTSKVA